MKKPLLSRVSRVSRVSRGTLVRWLAVAALCAAPTFIRYELTSARTFTCSREGAYAGLCYGEATLRQRVHLDVNDWDTPPGQAPRVWFMPVTRIDDIGMAMPSGGEHLLRLEGSPACFSRASTFGFSQCRFGYADAYVIPLDDSYSPSDERTAAVQLNAFLQNPKAKTYRLRQPGPFRIEFALFYLVAGLVGFLTVRRSLALRTEAWLKAVEEIPATQLTAYRGQV